MPDMQLFKCLVALGGDDKMLVPPSDRGWGQGVVSGPEIEVLRAAHGEGTVRDIAPVDMVAEGMTTKKEKARLLRLYAAKVVEGVFPGVNPQMDLSPAIEDLVDEGSADGDEDDTPAPVKKRARVTPPAKVLEARKNGDATPAAT